MFHNVIVLPKKEACGMGRSSQAWLRPIEVRNGKEAMPARERTHRSIWFRRHVSRRLQCQRRHEGGRRGGAGGEAKSSYWLAHRAVTTVVRLQLIRRSHQDRRSKGAPQADVSLSCHDSCPFSGALQHLSSPTTEPTSWRHQIRQTSESFSEIVTNHVVNL